MTSTRHNLWSWSLGLFLNTGSDMILSPSKWVSDHRNVSSPLSLSALRTSLACLLPLSTHLSQVLGFSGRTSGWIGGANHHLKQVSWAVARAPLVLSPFTMDPLPCNAQNCPNQDSSLKYQYKFSLFHTPSLCRPLRCQCQKWQSQQHGSVFYCCFWFPIATFTKILKK